MSILNSRFESHLFPYLGRQPIKSIRAQELLSVLRRAEARGTHETAHRVRALAGRVFRYAVATGRAEHDVSADLKDALAPVKTKNFAAILEPSRVGALLRAIDGYAGQPVTAPALKLAPLVFVRPGELRAAEWSEFDFEKAEWRIPGARMKMGEQHIVPLARQAIDILKALQPLTNRGRYVFPSLLTRDRPISDNTINAALRRLGYNGDEQTGHGFRSMASTLLNEQGFPPDVIELQLAHAERNKVRAAYNKAQRLGERRKMMQAWADYLDRLRAGLDTAVA
ncbi:MAG: integrase [Gammaproteobacteria bacterium]|nr:integrase [Gammaproteobacteria bacterium]